MAGPFLLLCFLHGGLCARNADRIDADTGWYGDNVRECRLRVYSRKCHRTVWTEHDSLSGHCRRMNQRSKVEQSTELLDIYKSKTIASHHVVISGKN